jgi:UDPglucose--hexose-1-phosphate uridylyltransferase
LAKYEAEGKVIDASNVETILQQEVGLVFCQVLEDAGVFKGDEKGRDAFRRFVQTL